MPFQYILANLLAKNEGALGALFLDSTGETVDLACADGSPYQMRLIGAYVGIALRQLERMVGGETLGTPRLFHLEREGLHLHAVCLPDGYYLVLVQRQPALVAQARRTLAEASEQLERALFSAS